MAVEVCSSPRISFSHNLCPSHESGTVRVEHRPCPTHSSTFDFTFYRLLHAAQQPCSSADELFSDGKILPAAGIIHKTPPSSPPPPHTQKQSCSSNSYSNSKSFWRFKRSRSVNHCSSGSRYGVFRNFQIIPRSKSTGSTVKSHREKPPPPPPLPPRRSSYGGSSSGGIHLNTVLNVPIANLCGFASLCFTGKVSGSKKCQ